MSFARFEWISPRSAFMHGGLCKLGGVKIGQIIRQRDGSWLWTIGLPDCEPQGVETSAVEARFTLERHAAKWLRDAGVMPNESETSPPENVAVVKGLSPESNLIEDHGDEDEDHQDWEPI